MSHIFDIGMSEKGTTPPKPMFSNLMFSAINLGAQTHFWSNNFMYHIILLYLKPTIVTMVPHKKNVILAGLVRCLILLGIALSHFISFPYRNPRR